MRVSRVSRVQQPAAEQCRGIWGRGGIWVVGGSRGRGEDCLHAQLSLPPEGLSRSAPQARPRTSPVLTRSMDSRQRYSRSCHCCAAKISRWVGRRGSWEQRHSVARGAGPPRGGTGRDPCGAGYRMLGVRDGDRLSRVEVSGSVVSALCFVCPKSLLSARRLYEAAGCGLYCSLNIARGSALATNPED